MARFYPSGRRGTGTPGLRLLKFLMVRGGGATLWEISRRSADGRLYAQAKPELDGLITLEKCGSPKSRRRCTRVFLTVKGWAACAMLRPAWTPQRLATDTLKAWILELQNERDLWACQFIKDAVDAAELRRLRSIGWIRPPLKKRGPPKGVMPKGGFQKRAVFSPASVAPQAPITPDTEITPSQPYAQRDFLRDLAEQNRLIAEIQQPQRMYRQPAGDTSSADNERKKIFEKAKLKGYPREGNKIQFNSEWFDYREWNTLVPD